MDARLHSLAELGAAESAPRPPLRSVTRERLELMATRCALDPHPLAVELHDLLEDALARVPADAPRVVLSVAGVYGPYPRHVTVPEVQP